MLENSFIAALFSNLISTKFFIECNIKCAGYTTYKGMCSKNTHCIIGAGAQEFDKVIFLCSSVVAYRF